MSAAASSFYYKSAQMAEDRDDPPDAESSARDPFFQDPKPKKKEDRDAMSPSRKRALKRAKKERQRTSGIVLLNAAAALDGCDDQLLPASFRALEAELGFYPTLLGKISLVQTMALSLSCPFWGYVADRYPRQYVISIGICSWGVATVLLAFASQISHIFILRGINGVFLGSIGPISQSVLADLTPDMARGLQFGLVQMCASAGRVVGGVITTSVSFLHAGGMSGWRWTFLAVGLLSLLLGLLIGILPLDFSREKKQRVGFGPLVTVEPPLPLPPGPGTGETRTQTPPGRSLSRLDSMESTEDLDTVPEHQGAWSFFKEVWRESLWKKSVVFILLEGIVGIIPWSAMAFLTMFMQYVGLSDLAAGCVAGSLLFGAMVAGPLGGFIGDKVHGWSPNHGRPFLGQLSMMVRVPLLVVAFLVVPQVASSLWLYIGLFLGVGLFSFAGVVVSRPLLSDVVRPKHRATTFGLVVAIEGAAAALFGAPGVGFLVERVFGYIKTDKHVNDLPPEVLAQNARALSHGLVCLTAIPWILSFLFYGCIHLTYSKDRDLIREQLESDAHTRQEAQILRLEASMGEAPERKLLM